VARISAPGNAAGRQIGARRRNLQFDRAALGFVPAWARYNGQNIKALTHFLGRRVGCGMADIFGMPLEIAFAPRVAPVSTSFDLRRLSIGRSVCAEAKTLGVEDERLK